MLQPNQDDIEQNLEQDVEEEIIEPQDEDNVTLTKDQYNALMDRIGDLEALATAPKANDNEDDDALDFLTNEGKKGINKQDQEQQQQQVNVDEMSNTQLLSYAMNGFNQLFAKQNQAIESLTLQIEINDVKANNKDFDLYQKEVFNLAAKDPNMSILQAYKLAKVEDPDRAERSQKGEAGKTTVTEKLLRLPPRGEKPGIAPGSTTKDARALTIKEAASKAYEEVTKLK